MSQLQQHTLGRGRRAAGLTLVELLVAITIGAVLIFGATQVYVDSRNAFATNEATARLQENSRYAMSVLEPDIRMANYWGLLKGSASIIGRAGKADTQSSLGGNAATSCGKNYGLDLDNNIDGTNDSYPTVPAGVCTPFQNTLMPYADTLTIRRASTVLDNTNAGSGPLRICSTRVRGLLVTDSSTDLCTGITLTPPDAQINDLIVHLYYVDSQSGDANGVVSGLPSLRRKSLTYTAGAGGGNDFADEEVMRGVEDMQVQYGIDPSGGYGDAGGAATQYLDAGATLTGLAASGQIASVRVWLLVRAETPETGFVDNRVYEYGDRLAANGTTGDLTSATDINKAYQPSLSTDNSFTGVKHYRRLLISRTIQIRNALGT